MARRIRFDNAIRHGREYRADLLVDDKMVGTVTRAQDGRGGGYRASEYKAKVNGWLVATGGSLSELRAELREASDTELSLKL